MASSSTFKPLAYMHYQFLFSQNFFSFYLGIAFSILQEIKNELDRLDRPTTLSGTEFLGLSSTTNTTVEFTERNTLLVFLDVVEVSIGLAQLHALDSNSNFVGVFELQQVKIFFFLSHLCFGGYIREHEGKNLWTWQLYMKKKN
jgi:hypothetical protein